MSEPRRRVFAPVAASPPTHRRAALRTVGAGALFAVIRPTGVAGKAGKNVKKRCRRQGGECRGFFEEACPASADPDACLELTIPCCALLDTCQAGAFLECLLPLPASP